MKKIRLFEDWNSMMDMDDSEFVTDIIGYPSGEMIEVTENELFLLSVEGFIVNYNDIDDKLPVYYYFHDKDKTKVMRFLDDLIYESVDFDFEDFDWEEEDPDKRSFEIITYDTGREPQRGFRFYLYDSKTNKIVNDFKTFKLREVLKLLKCTSPQINKVITGEYFITNGFMWGHPDFQKITYQELIDMGIELKFL